MGKAVGFALLSSALLEIEEINDLYAVFFSGLFHKKATLQTKENLQEQRGKGQGSRKKMTARSQGGKGLPPRDFDNGGPHRLRLCSATSSVC